MEPKIVQASLGWGVQSWGMVAMIALGVLPPIDYAIHSKPEPFCPECGGRMILKRPKKGQRWSAFWGCQGWSDCSGKRQVGSDGCPESDDPDPSWID